MKRLSLLFYVKKSKLSGSGTAPIYVRLTLGEKRFELATKRSVAPEKWHSMAQKVLGNTEDIKSLNAHLKFLEKNIYDAFHELSIKEKEVSIEALKEKLTGKNRHKNFQSLVSIFKAHNNEVKALVGNCFAAGTLQRYETTLKHTIDFLQWKYRSSDISIEDVNHDFITSFEFYLRSERRCGNNSAVKYIKNFKKIIRICMANGWLLKDPFSHYKAKVKEVSREFLTSEELKKISSKVLGSERLEVVRDSFLFSCYTGLAYSDVRKLKRSEIVMGIDGGKWIFTSRRKTGIISKIPLLPYSLDLLLKYEEHPVCVNKGLAFPVLSNQKMNAYLKEIADLCGIQKPMTFHMARHTFATTVTLSNGVPIETVSKMLEHTNLKITQHYARILDQKLSEDVGALRKKLELFNEKSLTRNS